MSFEKNMMKKANAKLDEMVPNPYPKKPFPLWAKISLPVGSAVLASAIALGAILPGLVMFDLKTSFVTPLKADKVQSVDYTLVNRVAIKALKSLDPYLAGSSQSNYALSPASYILAVSALTAVSDGIDASAFGLENAEKDCKSLLEAWNFLYEKHESDGGAYTRFDSGVLHQSVGGSYRFDGKKMERFASDYIATSNASLKDYHQQATEYFHKTVGLTIPVPDPKLSRDGVITYGALKMRDSVPGQFFSGDRPFHAGERTINVSSRTFGSVYYPESLPYYKGENYQAFQMRVSSTDLLFVLPDEGVSLESVSVSEAYASFREHRENVDAMGYTPYFHAHSENVDLKSAFASKLSGQPAYYSKLLADDVHNDLRLDAVLQSSDFQFDRYGVAGESITVMSTVGSAEPNEHPVVELNVDRPFYAISLKDWFPLFVNKVTDPSK